jgi:hypothetical protein
MFHGSLHEAREKAYVPHGDYDALDRNVEG